jgi:hypothetical protein
MLANEIAILTGDSDTIIGIDILDCLAVAGLKLEIDRSDEVSDEYQDLIKSKVGK